MSCSISFVILEVICSNITYGAIIYTDGVEIWRKGIRNSNFVLDHVLTVLGFSGFENIDWECVRSIPKT
jgi:hypothetical protein